MIYTFKMMRNDSRRAIAAYKSRKDAKEKAEYGKSQSAKPQKFISTLAVLGMTSVLLANSAFA